MITINDKARDYILTKGGCIHVLHGNGAAMCCGRVNFGPSIEIGEPREIRDYTLVMMNEIQVYLPKNFHIHYPLVIGLGNFLGIKSLRIEGWKLL
ncbi:CC/Se motif family (seleno)protein [Pelosinus sp. sgz500959]|uniref:CC/Se motif family (seleno)protein n=1 Tax=Pelosinus sp. sgz500959 TaxID=3242472 RepID=UPI003672C634